MEEYGWAKSLSMFRALPGHLGACPLDRSQMVLCQKIIKLYDSTRTMPVAASITDVRTWKSKKECRIASKWQWNALKYFGLDITLWKYCVKSSGGSTDFAMLCGRIVVPWVVNSLCSRPCHQCPSTYCSQRSHSGCQDALKFRKASRVKTCQDLSMPKRHPVLAHIHLMLQIEPQRRTWWTLRKSVELVEL